MMKNRAKNHCGMIRFQEPINISCPWNHPIYTAKIAPKICDNNLTHDGNENLILPIYLSSSKSCTRIIGNAPIINPRNRLFCKYSGNSTATIPKNHKYVKTPSIVGTGFLVFLRSFPGLSKTFNFLKIQIPSIFIITTPIKIYNKVINSDG